MAYTYSDVQNSTAAYALEGASSATPDGSMDLERWTALQSAYTSGALAPATNTGSDSSSLAVTQGLGYIDNLKKEATLLSTAQQVANIRINNDSFIRDSITGK